LGCWVGGLVCCCAVPLRGLSPFWTGGLFGCFLWVVLVTPSSLRRKFLFPSLVVFSPDFCVPSQTTNQNIFVSLVSLCFLFTPPFPQGFLAHVPLAQPTRSLFFANAPGYQFYVLYRKKEGGISFPFVLPVCPPLMSFVLFPFWLFFWNPGFGPGPFDDLFLLFRLDLFFNRQPPPSFFYNFFTPPWLGFASCRPNGCLSFFFFWLLAVCGVVVLPGFANFVSFLSPPQFFFFFPLCLTPPRKIPSFCPSTFRFPIPSWFFGPVLAVRGGGPGLGCFRSSWPWFKTFPPCLLVFSSLP